MKTTGQSTSLLAIAALFIVVSLVGCATNSAGQVAISTLSGKHSRNYPGECFKCGHGDLRQAQGHWDGDFI